MKHLLLSLVIVFFFFTNTNAQLTADAGPDQNILDCQGASVMLGGPPTASGGVVPYTYSWSPAAGLNDPSLPHPIVSNIGATMLFVVTVTDAIGDTATDDVLVTVVPSTLSASASTTDSILCSLNNVFFIGTATGGSPPYSYFWDFGDGNVGFGDSTWYNHSPGNYNVTLTVTDNFCTITVTLPITVQSECGPFYYTGADLICGGVCDGTVTINAVTPGSYRYQWSNGDTSQTRSDVCAGLHYVTVTDAALTPLDTVMVILNQPGPLVLSSSNSHVTCTGLSTGSITLGLGGGGIPPHTFVWNDGFTGRNRTNLPVGSYSVTVTDSRGCSASFGTLILEPVPLTVTTTSFPESTTGACDGAINATVSGGNLPYSYLWSNAASTEDLVNLCAGTYTVTIVDANGCSASSMSVVSASCVNNTIVLTLSSTGDIDCTNSFDTITANVTGGTPPYVYQWNAGVVGPSFIVSFGGIYTVWVTDSLGCTRTASDTVLNTGVVVSLQSVINPTCNGVTNGKIKVSVSGGVPPYTYAWSNGGATDSITSIPAGTYTLTVTDAGACSVTFPYTLNQVNSNWSYYVYGTSTGGNCNIGGSATATPHGGVPPYTYLWNTTPPQTTVTATDLNTGSYTVSVTDAGGCIRTGNITVYNSCRNIILGQLIRDLNGNCVPDSGETPLAYHTVIATGSFTTYYGYTNSQGYFSIQVPAGTFTVRPQLSNVCIENCASTNTSYTYTFPSVGDTVQNSNFYLVLAPYDLYVSLGNDRFRPGFTRTVYVYYGNAGYNNTSATLTYTYDADLVFVSATGNPTHNIATRTLTWNVSNIPGTGNHNSYSRYFTVDLQTPVGTAVGTSITNSVTISGAPNECDTIDNRYTSTTLVSNSFDPNEKEVMPAGDIYDETDSLLTYTIHFQNTGNDTAWFVILKDTLSPLLEAASVRNIAASHVISEFNLSGEGILTWVFNPIYLVDSATNVEGSKGFVTFSVKKKSGLAIGTQITNTAHIYFDYNLPVVTNTVSSKIADPNYIFALSNDENISAAAMPNPFTQSTQIAVEGVNSAFDFELFDVTGKSLKKITSINENRFQLQRDYLSAGIYFYSITTTAGQRAHGRLVVE